jgi:non-ribosomal peptide synthetase component E (peptide arylation enzyme)
LGKPDATKNALTSDGWYKTGDVCTIDEHGIFKIVDRKKELIKVKGVSIGEYHLPYSNAHTAALDSSKSHLLNWKVSFWATRRSQISVLSAFGKILLLQNYHGTLLTFPF